MAKISFVVWPYLGSQIACIKLADALRKRGHAVSYIGLEDSEEYIKSYGFEFFCVFQQHFPKGYLNEWIQLNTMPFGMEYICALKQAGNRLRRFFDDLLSMPYDNSLLDSFNKINPELLVLASAQPEMEWIAILAHSVGIRCIYFHDMLTPCEESGFPPPTSNLFPPTDLWGRVQVYLAWRAYHMVSLMLHILFFSINGIHLGDFSKKLADKLKLPWRTLENTGLNSKIIRLQELVSFPLDFDFPGAGLPGRYYIGTSLFLDRKDCDFPWYRLVENQPLIYCALGSILSSYEQQKVKDLFKIFIDTSAFRPSWQWVLSVGGAANPEDFDELPTNVIVVKNAPQIDILRRATIMITHGGANTIKECMYFGVPVIIITAVSEPFAMIEIPAYTARAVYHGLGVEIRIKTLSSSRLSETIDVVDKDPYIRSQTKLMQAKVRKLEEDHLDVRLVETILSSNA